MTNSLSLHERPDLATERLLLRRPNENDADAIVSTVGDWEVARRLARVPHPYGHDDAKFYLDNIVPNEWAWAITLRDTTEFVGVVGLTPKAEGVAELGYWVAPAHWSNGIATEAGEAVLNYGFGALDLSFVTSGYHEGNPASGRVLEKLGFAVTGKAARPSMAVGKDVPSIEVLLLRP